MPTSPNKQLGQHWLDDPAALDAVVSAAAVNPGDTILEVGPGLGTLSVRLLNRGARVVAVELDGRLAANLQKSFVGSGLEVVEGDVLKFDERGLPKDYAIVANIPYYITAPILQKFVYSLNPPQKLCLLVQKEVAERLAAGSGELSVLAISVQLKFEVALGPVIPARLFRPVPKVDSQVVLLYRRPKPLVSADEAELMRLIKAGFANKRKTLVNSLGSLPHYDKSAVSRSLRHIGQKPAVRAQELSIETWEKLYNKLTISKK